MNFPYRYITVEGNIGAGKTTLATKLAVDLKGKLILERFEENPFLPGFYRDPEKFAFQLELSFLADRYQQLKETTVKPDMFSNLVISDYFFPKCHIFAHVNLAGDEMNLFLRLFSIIDKHLPSPDLIIYLYHDLENLRNNIVKRGREYERTISISYLSDLHKGYMAYFRSHPELTVLLVDVNRINFAEKEADYRLMKELIARPYLPGINRAG
ncbi:MAG: deoxynucleoside kinase [Bacteroidetes bacterium]|nr:deoxynucleoside kinase [Bacteroidota bacterium]